MARRPDKRQPTLADRFISHRYPAHERYILPKTMDMLQRATRNAHKFVFTEEACERIAQVVLDIPHLIVREHGFARPPFDLTWIELPSWVYWNTLRKADPARYERAGIFGNLDTADHTVGYLFDHNRINVVVGGTMDKPVSDPHVTAVQYQLRTEWLVDDQIEFARLCGCSRMTLDMLLWGTTWDDIAEDERRLLRAYNVMEVTPLNPAHRKYPAIMRDAGLSMVARGCVGELRTIIAVLLMLNRPTLTSYRNTLPGVRSFFGGKDIPFMSHTTVTIAIDPVPTLRLVGTPAGDAVPRRRHEVRGHYCHNKEARDYSRIAGCIHDFQPNHGPPKWLPWPDAGPDDPDNWVCSECGGKRWWRPEHERGDASRGYVVHDDYEVVRRRQ